jgi:endogenous inhibitor of DNA gyrase (YacG/DUF329 family)
MVLGRRSVPIMRRQLQSVLGATTLKPYSYVFGWPRTTACAFCGASYVRLYRCTRCDARFFCSKACQIIDWRAEHKRACTHIAPCFDVRDFCTGPMEADDLQFRNALLGPHRADIGSAVFASTDIAPGTPVMRMRPRPPVLASDKHPTHSVGTTVCAARANCKWRSFRRAPGVPVHMPRLRAALLTTRAVIAGERLVVLEE